MTPDRYVIARAADWEICRYERSGTYWIEYVGPDLPPTSIPVQGVDWPLATNSHRTKCTVAQAAMLTAWTGARLVAPSPTAQFSRYLRAHRARAAEAGIHPVFPIPQ